MSPNLIIGIHGLNNKPPKEPLKTGWLKAMAEGLKKNIKLDDFPLEFDLAYWADI